MIIAKLTIKNVVINLDVNGKLIYILPSHFDGNDFSKFKAKYKNEISAFKELHSELLDITNSGCIALHIEDSINFISIENDDFNVIYDVYSMFTIVGAFVHKNFEYRNDMALFQSKKVYSLM